MGKALSTHHTVRQERKAVLYRRPGAHRPGDRCSWSGIFLLWQVTGNVSDGSRTTPWWLQEPRFGWSCALPGVPGRAELGSKPPVDI